MDAMRVGGIIQIKYLKKVFLQVEWNKIYKKKKLFIIFILRNKYD